MLGGVEFGFGSVLVDNCSIVSAPFLIKRAPFQNLAIGPDKRVVEKA
jgi:hypothetical protein